MIMKLSNVADSLWGHQAKFSYLLIASVVLLFTLLGGRDLWTQEHRWADIVAGMFYRQDFLHPYLGDQQYYDKPLLSYWLIAVLTKLSGSFTTLTLRLPSALAGVLAIWSIYRLGTKLKDKSLGLLSGWLLLTTFYFVFWARTSSADMLNLAGSLFAVSWYMDKREEASFFDYAVFFLIISMTALCKGLIGIIVPVLAVFTDICLQKSWKQHLRLPLFLATIPGLIIYLAPFFASSYFDGISYGQSGLYLVYRENILRYFQPFDHKGPIYTYFIYLPVYLFPWAIFFIPALGSLVSRWKSMSINSKWVVWTLLLLFLFFTLSGSRRSYYVLPMVPFAILLTADWILSSATPLAKRCLWTAGTIILSFLLLFVALDVVPTWYYSQFGVSQFASTLKTEAGKIKPWSAWNVVMLDADTKLTFYLQLPPDQKLYGLKGDRDSQTAATLRQLWPILENKPANTIFITRKQYASSLQEFFVGYRLVELSTRFDVFMPNNVNEAVAFIPV